MLLWLLVLMLLLFAFRPITRANALKTTTSTRLHRVQVPQRKRVGRMELLHAVLLLRLRFAVAVLAAVVAVVVVAVVVIAAVSLAVVSLGGARTTIAQLAYAATT